VKHQHCEPPTRMLYHRWHVSFFLLKGRKKLEFRWIDSLVLLWSTSVFLIVKEESESPHNILVFLFGCKERGRRPKKDQRRTKESIHLSPGFPCLLKRAERNMPGVDRSNWGVRDKEIETLDASMAKQKRKRKALALSTIVKLSSTKLNAQLKPIPRPPRVRRRTRHRPARQCCVTQSEEQVASTLFWAPVYSRKGS
jgi:hypothetical protein